MVKPSQESSSVSTTESDTESIPSSSSPTPADLETAQRESVPFLGRWNRLISTTNWEKGRIIHQWRTALVAAAAPATQYSDEAWSRLVGGSVSPQHVGRLRRTFDRFGEVQEQYPGLYWSHFLAALDWDDAEMYLEGAVQSAWSVSQMRMQKWEAEGRPKDKKPSDKDIVAAEHDEDSPAAKDLALRSSVETVDEARGGAFGPDFGDEADSGSATAPGRTRPADGTHAARKGSSLPAARPFKDLPRLPDDVAEAFESFKLAILHHKLDGWRQVARDDLLATLDALKELALAPSDRVTR